MKLIKKKPLKLIEEDRLRDEWYEKLSEDGFIDIEDCKGNLKQYDRRTIAFENRDAICGFFIRLDHYLTHTPDIPEPEKSILELYTQGFYTSQIQRKLKIDQWSVKKVIKHYKTLIISLFHNGEGEYSDDELKLDY